MQTSFLVHLKQYVIGQAQDLRRVPDSAGAWTVECTRKELSKRLVRLWNLRRDMNAATSQHVFAGPYLDDGAEREKFSAAFMDMTQVPVSSPSLLWTWGHSQRLICLCA